ncbi:CPCC family cysteine-rich protein [Inhella proteolytica]|uniref:Cysteine-rich CPCC domain-containing protein n=1 Tax=Inhella proteolytica TaxID=2795029 RepID=A0A931J205_9BURK|nr:hypothetical protein [Inhella proteolytica]
MRANHPPGLIQCDCCDYFTIPSGHDYEICPVCFWEQDWCGVAEPEEPSGANHGLTLRQGRENFAKNGACSAEFQDRVLAPNDRSQFKRVFRVI